MILDRERTQPRRMEHAQQIAHLHRVTGFPKYLQLEAFELGQRQRFERRIPYAAVDDDRALLERRALLENSHIVCDRRRARTRVLHKGQARERRPGCLYVSNAEPSKRQRQLMERCR